MSNYAYAPIYFIHVLILPCSYKNGAQKEHEAKNNKLLPNWGVKIFISFSF